MREHAFSVYVARETACRDTNERKKWQLARIREQIALAKTNSRFYRQLFCGIEPENLHSLHDLKRLPFTYPDDLRRNAEDFICCPMRDIERIVTLKSSGTMGKAKRIFFTQNDLSRTVDFFNFGMREMAQQGDSVAVFLPCEQEGSVGALLREGLLRIGAQVTDCSALHSIASCYDALLRCACTGIVAMPTQALALAAYSEQQSRKLPLHFALLSADDVPQSLSARVERAFSCKCFRHYGMTETGYGAAVDCRGHIGCHIRENDLFVEIVDPDSGSVLPYGHIGEIVITTLRREAMPLIRYCTGDLGYLVNESCTCGSNLMRLIPQGGRILDWHGNISLAVLNEILFMLPDVIDFEASVDGNRLHIRLLGLSEPNEEAARELLYPYLSHCALTLTTDSGTVSAINGNGMIKRHLIIKNQ